MKISCSTSFLCPPLPCHIKQSSDVEENPSIHSSSSSPICTNVLLSPVISSSRRTSRKIHLYTPHLHLRSALMYTNGKRLSIALARHCPSFPVVLTILRLTSATFGDLSLKPYQLRTGQATWKDRTGLRPIPS